jgi:hypothetical protein
VELQRPEKKRKDLQAFLNKTWSYSPKVIAYALEKGVFWWGETNTGQDPKLKLVLEKRIEDAVSLN